MNNLNYFFITNHDNEYYIVVSLKFLSKLILILSIILILLLIFFSFYMQNIIFHLNSFLCVIFGNLISKIFIHNLNDN